MSYIPNDPNRKYNVPDWEQQYWKSKETQKRPLQQQPLPTPQAPTSALRVAKGHRYYTQIQHGGFGTMQTMVMDSGVLTERAASGEFVPAGHAQTCFIVEHGSGPVDLASISPQTHPHLFKRLIPVRSAFSGIIFVEQRSVSSSDFSKTYSGNRNLLQG